MYNQVIFFSTELLVGVEQIRYIRKSYRYLLEKEGKKNPISKERSNYSSTSLFECVRTRVEKKKKKKLKTS